MNKIHRVTIYCASSSLIDECYFAAARELSAMLASHGIECIYGAGDRGLMGCIADSMLSNGGKVTGIIPRFMVEHGWCRQNLTEVITTESMHERKTLMAQMGDAAIALPGGCGTFEELLELITWKQLGLYTHPIVILNTAGYYDPLLQMLEKAIECHFMRDIHSQLWHVAETPRDVIDGLETLPEWDAKLGKDAVAK